MLWPDGTSTPPKINIEPANDGLEDDLTFPGVHSQVNHVNLPWCTIVFPPFLFKFHHQFWVQMSSVSRVDSAVKKTSLPRRVERPFSLSTAPVRSLGSPEG